jgi:hypothetical protein
VQPPQLGLRDSAAGTPGIDQPAFIGVVAEQQRAEERPRPLRIGEADNDELLAVEAFRLPP